VKTFLAEDGAKLAYLDEGQGLPLLCLAGLTRDGRDFDYLARHLSGDVRLIRLDSRGRGQSDWTGAASYTVAQEARDVLALLDHLGLQQVALLGTSRGGLIGLVLAASAKARLLGLCLNDVGPVVERAGLDRIAAYVGIEPPETSLADVAERLGTSVPGFDEVPRLRWQDEAVRHYVQLEGKVGLTYDPALRDAFLAALAAPVPDLWPLFDACAGLSLALIRGAGSDVLSRATADDMCRRRPDMLFADVPMRGHIPFLDEPESLAVIARWLDQVATTMDPGAHLT
jgi:pimeloyl-ACP methyl ester carboxylesterase